MKSTNPLESTTPAPLRGHQRERQEPATLPLSSAEGVSRREYAFTLYPWEIRAALDGKKTQARRAISDQNSRGNFRASELLLDDPRVFIDGGPSPAGNPGPYLHAWLNCPEVCRRRGWREGDCDPSVVERLYPMWRRGDLLWTRETFALESSWETGWYEPPHNDGRPLQVNEEPDGYRWWQQPHYRATDPEPELDIGTGDPGVRWRPSIFMPRWASRLTLEVLSVRVERLQDISEGDAKAEGVTAPWLGFGSWDYIGPSTHREAFALLWDRINAKRAPWASNPWVWVLEFRRVEAGA